MAEKSPLTAAEVQTIRDEIYELMDKVVNRIEFHAKNVPSSPFKVVFSAGGGMVIGTCSTFIDLLDVAVDAVCKEELAKTARVS